MEMGGGHNEFVGYSHLYDALFSGILLTCQSHRGAAILGEDRTQDGTRPGPYRYLRWLASTVSRRVTVLNQEYERIGSQGLLVMTKTRLY